MRAVLPLCLALFAFRAVPQSSVDAKTLPTQQIPVPPQTVTPPGPLDYVCPMDKDVRSDKPGVCPRCGMKLVLGIPDQTEYPVELKTAPPQLKSGQKTHLTFEVRDPKNGSAVKQFEIVHEKLYHMFIVSNDLEYFIHEHPEPKPDGSFVYEEVFPKAGMYRVLSDFYPTGGIPQLISKTLFVAGDPNAPISLEETKLEPDLKPKHGENLDVELVVDPPQPVAGAKTLMFFKLNPADGLQKYLGAWAHMLAASDDLIDTIHDHPFIADGGPHMQFNVIFPRARTYRIWIQFERNGVVNTVAFNLPVSTLK